MPIVHYFAKVGHNTYEYFNYYVLTDNTQENIVNYFYRLLDPRWVAIQYNGQCVAEVIGVVPAPIVIIIMAVALTTAIYYAGKRIW
jgi:fumarate reductase subunit C